MKKALLLAALLMTLDGSAYAGNVSQNTLDNKVVAITITVTNTWQQVAKSDVQRQKMWCQNLSSANSMAFYFSTYANNNVAPTVGNAVGSAGSITVPPLWGWEPDGGWIDGGEIWVLGTSGDKATCYLSNTQP